MAANVTREEWGTNGDGAPVQRYTLRNTNGLLVRVSSYGALITELHVPDRAGNMDDVVLGFDTVQEYIDHSPFFGATVGRVANRIAKGTFTVDGKEYRVAVNNGPNALHGGLKGFDKQIWKVTPLEGDDAAIRLAYQSHDGEEGYPGNLSVRVTMTLTEKNELRLEYEATTDAPTPINLTNHSYFNLAGDGHGTVLDHEVEFAVDRYTPVDKTLIPTGEIASVEGTPFDFRQPHKIGERIQALADFPGGYDHNLVLRGEGGGLAFGARVHEPASGRVMEMHTTQPGVQFYTGNFLDGKVKGKHGHSYPKYGGFCLETQHFPDSVHHPEFPSAILKPGETYRQTTVYRFSTR